MAEDVSSDVLSSLLVEWVMSADKERSKTKSSMYVHQGKTSG
jgi:hypothetical protein